MGTALSVVTGTATKKRETERGNFAQPHHALVPALHGVASPRRAEAETPKYTIGERVGAGTFGEVWLGTAPDGGKVCARGYKMTLGL